MIIKPSDIKNYYGATGDGIKNNRSLNNKELIDYIQNLYGLKHIEIDLVDNDEICFMKFVFNESINGGLGFVIEYLVNKCGCSVRFEEGVCFNVGIVYQCYELEFEFE